MFRISNKVRSKKNSFTSWIKPVQEWTYKKKVFLDIQANKSVVCGRIQNSKEEEKMESCMAATGMVLYQMVIQNMSCTHESNQVFFVGEKISD